MRHCLWVARVLCTVILQETEALGPSPATSAALLAGNEAP